MLILGVDIGGTFTDFVLFDGKNFRIKKIASTPHNPAEAVISGIQSFDIKEKQPNIVHGSTVATNTLLERNGAKVALITTKGYEDIIEIGRQNRSKLYDLFITREPPLVPGRLRWGVKERVTSTGDVLQNISKNDLRDLIAKVKKNKIEAVAVCFLFSYMNSKNERCVMNGLKQNGLHVSASHKILPEYREYERFSTTIANAYVTPVMSRYITSLEDELEAKDIRIMQSNGGIISTKSAKERSINCILSGPAGGVIGATEIAKTVGFRKIVTFDMGGTSTDVSLYDNKVRLTTNTIVSGIPIKVPMIDIYTVGAGGGSMAGVGPVRALRVGPKSAGADPGPVCYGKGKSLTVTDANLFLGRICAERFLGGRMKLYADKVTTHINSLAKKLKIRPVHLAEGIIDVINSNMERAIKVISIEKGFDVRDFTLVSFGGSGGLHACELAKRLSMKGVLVPRNAGVLSAFGMSIADTVRDYSKSILVKVKQNEYEKLLKRFNPLIKQCQMDILNEGVQMNGIKVEQYIDMRYVGQSHELTLPFKKSYFDDFHKTHKKTFGYANREYDVEIVNIRVREVVRSKKYKLNKALKCTQDKGQRAIKRTRCLYKGRWLKTNVYDRNRPMAGLVIKGPALIDDDLSATFIPQKLVCKVDEYDNLIVRF